jgi:hypothetical protein
VRTFGHCRSCLCIGVVCVAVCARLCACACACNSVADVTVCIGQEYESKAADVRAKQAARRGQAEAADGDAGDAPVVK